MSPKPEYQVKRDKGQGQGTRNKGQRRGKIYRAGVTALAGAFAFASFSGRASSDLFFDDFSRFPPGLLTAPIGQLNGAIQEYHYLPHRGVPLEPWANVITHLDAWAAGDEDGTPYVEQHTVNAQPLLLNPTLVTGDAEWGDYAVEARVKPLSLDDMAGIVFRYHTNRHYYLFSLSGGTKARLLVRLPLEKTLRIAEWRELASTAFRYDTTHYYTLKVENDGPRIHAAIDGKFMLEARDSELLKGKVGITANIPARFQAFRVTASDAARRAIDNRVRARDAELATLRQQNPQPKLWRKFDTPGFGTGRNVRFGDLDGDGQLDMLFAQNIPRVRGDAFDHISALTAVNLDGKILWQSGRPNPRNGLLTNDTPFQIHDIDGDGAQEVVLIRDFKLQVLDGKTGKVERWVWMPRLPTDTKDRPYELYSGDSIAFLNLSGRETRREILIKDRYRNFWVYNDRLEPMFAGQGQTGHYVFPADVDGDGKDEFQIGYSFWDHSGTRRWSHDEELQDHADGLAIANLSDDPKAEPRIYVSGSDEGIIIFDLRGKILNRQRVGHTQSVSIAKYRSDVPGLQYMTINFWRNPGIITLIDREGNILAQEEPVHMGSPILPVNWRGDGIEFAMLSGNVREGGLIDGRLRRVVMFPDDGHPDLAFQVANLTGDARDEIMLWDQERVWIYTQDRPFTGDRIYAPTRNPTCNDSNYRAAVSLPAWRAVNPSQSSGR
jgi:rhamnogalacturonan endolyase